MKPFLFKFKNSCPSKISDIPISYDSSIDMLIVNSGNRNEILINSAISIGTKKENNERGGGEDQKADLL